MKILIFDTETTGLPNKKEPDINKQPRIVQFAGIIWDLYKDGTWEKQEEINILINPGMPIPHQVSQIHGIYDIDVKDKPSAEEVIPGILEKMNGVDFIVAHNLKFDEQLIQLEVTRLKMKGLTLDYMPQGKICTMVAWTPICKLEKPSWGAGYKSPKLQELFYFLFKKYFKWAHDAMVDVKACWLAFVEMVKQEYIELEKVEKKQINLF